MAVSRRHRAAFCRIFAQGHSAGARPGAAEDPHAEREIITAVASDTGASAKTVSEQLHISEHTVRNHLTSIYDKLGVANRLALFAYAHKHGLVKRPS